ncbi:unnamed protein product [Choristocarpus tenellus]
MSGAVYSPVQRGGLALVILAAWSLLFSFKVGVAVDLPDEWEVLHANVVFRHGARSRLVKTATSEFGQHAGVAVSEQVFRSQALLTIMGAHRR